MRRVGYWRNRQQPELPDPEEFIDTDADRQLLEEVGRYLANGTSLAAYMGFSTCRICGEPNGSAEFSDGVYVWPEGLAHYVRDHCVRLPPELEQHALARLHLLESRRDGVDDEWWRQQMQR